jgi:biotin carboxyl carrier protein
MGDEFRALKLEDATYQTRFTSKFMKRKPYRPPDPKKITAFIPGVVPKIFVQPGQRVKRGDRLLLLDAMKMQNALAAPRDGTVKDIYVRPGQMVAKGALLLEFV